MNQFLKSLAVFLGLAVALTGASATPARSLESEPFSCYEALDCGKCVLNGCSWAAGSCIDDCTIIADVSCYSASPGMSADQVCRAVVDEENDWALCGAQGDCSSCTSTALSGGNGNCFWHPEWQACKPLFADAWSTGIDVCVGPTADSETCSTAGALGCHSCLEAGCVLGGGDCIPSCDLIADAACYSPEYFPGQTTNEICLQANIARMDSTICSGEDDCASCVATKKSDGVSTCMWYSDDFTGEAWCGTGECDMFGNCGSPTCDVPADASDPSCGARASCSSCLSEDSTCAWAVGSCMESCDLIMDAACYTKGTMTGITGTEICEMVEEEEADQEICGAVDDCQECTNTKKSDGQSSCSWYDDGAGHGYCGVGGCDMFGICGSDTCQPSGGFNFFDYFWNWWN